MLVCEWYDQAAPVCECMNYTQVIFYGFNPYISDGEINCVCIM